MTFLNYNINMLNFDTARTDVKIRVIFWAIFY